MKSFGFLWLVPIIGLLGVSAWGQHLVVATDGLDRVESKVETLAAPILCHYDLNFQPRADMQLVVDYEVEESWNYGKKNGMSGKSTKTATIVWTFQKQGRKGPYATSGSFEEATYTGKWTKGGKAEAADIAWTRGLGYAKGQGSSADKKWFAGEMKETLAFPINRRGEARPGEC